MQNPLKLTILIILLIASAALLVWKRANQEQVQSPAKQQAPEAQRVPTVTGISAAGTVMAVLRDDGTIWAWGGKNPGIGPVTAAGGMPGAPGSAVIAKAVFPGPNRMLVLKQDGQLWETNGYQRMLFALKLTAVKTAALGMTHAAAVKNDGTVWTWGENVNGQLGRTDRGSEPGIVNDQAGVPLADIAAVAVGGGHTVVIGKNGTVRAWGANSGGQLGIGNRGEQNLPQIVEGISDIVAVACGSMHTLVIARDGTLWAWGANDAGQLGDGTIRWRIRPVRISGLSDVIAVAAGDRHSMAVQRDGTVWVWGSNDRGQLGTEEVVSSHIPMRLARPVNATAAACGQDFSAVLVSDGTVWVWGDGRERQLGDGRRSHRTSPVLVALLGKATAIPPDEYAGTRTVRPAGSKLTFPKNVRSVAAGAYHSLALDQLGTIWAWGRNNAGQLGDGTTLGSAVAVPVTGTIDIVAVDGGGSHSASITKQGTVLTWGSNEHGQLGDGTRQNSSVPVAVKGLDGVASISAGWSHTVALKSDGTVWAWGRNDRGQLGEGSTMDSAVPVLVSGLNNVSAISAGHKHTIALGRDGTLWAWGANDSDRLGPGIPGDSTVPVRVKADGKIYAAVACDHHTLALTQWNGRVLSWGGNDHGQLGIGTITIPPVFRDDDPDIDIVPVSAVRPGHVMHQVQRWGSTNISSSAGDSALRAIVGIACGGNHSLAIDHNNRVYSWGAGTFGQLGSGGSRPWEDSALARTLISGATAIAAGQSHTLVLTSNGTVYAWGSNEFGQLGSGLQDDVWNQPMPVR